MNFKEKGEPLAPSSVFHFWKTITSRLIGPLQLVLHVVQTMDALGQDKQKSHIIRNVHFLCLSSPSACLALQHGSFVPREWPIVLGPVYMEVGDPR